jgi:hypothetical protein
MYTLGKLWVIPSQLLNSRRYKTKLPIKKDLLKPQTQNLEEIKRKLDQNKDIQIKHYNKKAGKEHARQKPGEDIRMAPLPGKKKWLPGTVVGLHTSPRSYVVDCGGRKYRRNRKFLRPATKEANKQDEVSTQENSWSDQNIDVGPNVKDLSIGMYDQQPKTTPQTHTEAWTNVDTNRHQAQPDTNTTNSPMKSRFGRTIKPPKRLIEED